MCIRDRYKSTDAYPFPIVFLHTFGFVGCIKMRARALRVAEYVVKMRARNYTPIASQLILLGLSQSACSHELDMYSFFRTE